MCLKCSDTVIWRRWSISMSFSQLLHRSLDATSLLPREQSGRQKDGPGFLLVCSCTLVFLSCLTVRLIAGILLNSSMDSENWLLLSKYCLIRQTLFCFLFVFFSITRILQWLDTISNLRSLLVEAQWCFKLCVSGIQCRFYFHMREEKMKDLKSQYCGYQSDYLSRIWTEMLKQIICGKWCSFPGWIKHCSFFMVLIALWYCEHKPLAKPPLCYTIRMTELFKAHPWQSST